VRQSPPQAVGLWVCVFVCLFVGLLPQKLEIACIDLQQTRSLKTVGEGSDHLQLIKFWPSCAPGKGSVAGQNFLAPPYYSQCVVFASLWALFHLKNAVLAYVQTFSVKVWNDSINFCSLNGFNVVYTALILRFLKCY